MKTPFCRILPPVAESVVFVLLLMIVSLLLGVDASYCHHPVPGDPDGIGELVIRDIPEWMSVWSVSASSFFIYPAALLAGAFSGTFAALRWPVRIVFTVDALVLLATTLTAFATWGFGEPDYTFAFATLAADATLRTVCLWKYGTCFYSLLPRRAAWVWGAAALILCAIFYDIATCPII